uniref:Uncharacterized protein n=1 Tax=Arundo donax TaxID=35708 RepID=A0A0A9AVZ8_ARUDO
MLDPDSRNGCIADKIIGQLHIGARKLLLSIIVANYD